MRTNALQILKENYKQANSEYESLREYVKLVSESDPSFFRWFLNDESLQDFQCNDTDTFEKFLDYCSDFKKINSFPGEIEDYEGDMGRNAIASFDKYDLELNYANRDDVSQIDVTAYIYEYEDKYYLEILYGTDSCERFESSDISELQKTAVDKVYDYVVEILDSFTTIDTNRFNSVECEDLDDFIENAEIGQKWMDEHGRTHYKTRYQSGDCVSFYYSDEGDVIKD